MFQYHILWAGVSYLTLFRSILDLNSTFSLHCSNAIWFYYHAALNADAARDENSACLSVKRVIYDKMGERSVQMFISYERSF